MDSLVIVGASLAGLSAARAARRQGFTGRLVIVGSEPHRPYDRPPLSKAFLAGDLGAEDLSLEGPDEGLDAEWLLGRTATAFDPVTREVVLDDGRRIRAEKLVIATGATARELPQLAGVGNATTLRTLDDAHRLRELLVPGGRLVVIGAGFIGAETASTARRLGMAVTVLERSAAPLAGVLGPYLAPVVAQMHRSAGVTLLCGTTVEGFTLLDGRVSHVHLTDGRALPADVVLVGIGAQPNVAWLAGSGVAVADGVVCDHAGRTTVPDVVAVGDCAAWWSPRTGSHERIEHWHGANGRAAVAVGALLGHQDGTRPAEPPYFWSDQYGTRLQFAGSAAHAETVAYEHGDPSEDEFLAVYYAGTEPVAVLGRNQPRRFTRWRKHLTKLAAQPAAETAVPVTS